MDEIDRWHNPDQLREDHDDVLRLIDRQGMIRCMDNHWISKARGTFLKIIVSLWDVVLGSTLSLVYCYDESIQPPNLANCDGYSSVSENPSDGRMVSSIGVSVQALQAGDSYAALVLLHELCHVLHGFPAHGQEFHKRLDSLIERYNLLAGGNVENDYQ